MAAETESPQTGRRDAADAALIAQPGREPEAFGLVFDRHAAAVHGYIARRLARDAADDLVAETFPPAFRRRRGYDPGQASVRPWLYVPGDPLSEGQGFGASGNLAARCAAARG